MEALNGHDGSAFRRRSESDLVKSESQLAVSRSVSAPEIVQSQPFRTATPSPHIIQAFKEDAACEKPTLCLAHPFHHGELALPKNLRQIKEDVIQCFACKLGVSSAKSPRTEILLDLLWEGLRFARSMSFNDYKEMILLNILYATHAFFLASEWRTSKETYDFLKETLLLHTVERPPWSVEVFQPLESQCVLKHVTLQYIRHLPLVHMGSLPVRVVQLSWTPAPGEVSGQALPADGNTAPRARK